MSSKVDRSDKFYSGPRKFFFPRRTFINVALSPKEAQKLRRWKDWDHEIALFVLAGKDELVLVDETQMEKMKK